MLLAGAVMGEARRCLATLSTETRRGGHGPRLQCSWEGGQAASCRCGWKSCCFPGPAADCKGARCHPWSSRSASDLHSPWQGQGDVPCGLACTACGNPEKIADDHRTNQPHRAFPIEPSHSERCDRIAHVQTVICSPLRNVSAIRLDAAQQTSLIFPRFHIYSKAASVEDAGQRPMPLTPAMRPSSHSRLLLPAVHVAHSECLKSHEHRAG